MPVLHDKLLLTLSKINRATLRCHAQDASQVSAVFCLFPDPDKCAVHTLSGYLKERNAEGKTVCMLLYKKPRHSTGFVLS
ncbi:unnamed protein product, partial [Amoebophrya sp. A120]|eukprot:GSA120T00019724001.1